MNYKRHILPALALVAITSACDDETMEWKAKGGVSINEIPLEVKEVLANYDDIKVYAQQYMPGSIIGIGMGVDLYNANANGEKDLVDANYQMFTCGNAMKMDALMTNSGSLNFTTLDNLFDNMPADMKLYGHNFFWHTQQRQAYLKSVIAPEVVIKADPSDKMENIVKNSDFEAGNTDGWGAWSSDGCKQQISEKGAGYESDYAIQLTNPVAGNNYSAQAFYTLPDITWEVGDVYILSFYAKADHVDANFQVELQNRNKYSAAKYIHAPLEAADTWYYFEKEITVDENFLDEAKTPTHITIDFGADEGNVWLDNVQFGKKKEGPTNYCSNGSFESDLDGWTAKNGADGISVVELDDAPDGSKALKMTASADAANAWDLQVVSPEMATMPGTKVELSFYVRSDQAGKGRVSFSGLTNGYPWMNWTGSQSSWTEAFETSTGWTLIHVVLQKFSTDFSDDASVWSFNLDFGYLPGVTYYLDNVKVVEYTEDESGNKSVNKASTITYVPKTAEQKKEALVKVMESWVSGVAEHLADKGVVPYGYDVINEPIADGSNGVRGLDGVFGGSEADADGNVTYDAEPEETTESGLSLNWGNNHWYWGYYVPDYAVRAFQLARKYLPAETKLFVNDYNLETSPAKLAALIEFINKIDADNGSAIVDGIGTQMHVTLSGTSDNAENNAAKIAACKEQVDAMFKTMAATGKLVRVTELDISLGASSPSSAQYQAQADCYEMIVKSYKENVPEAQQSGITIWSLSDNEAEHEYWLKGELPNLFDANYLRKWAYKGFCDGIAGEDLGLQFGGDLYKTYYERNNVSSTVK